MVEKISPLEKCKSLLEEFLLNANINICSSNSTDYLDGYVKDYLIEKGHTEFLEKDVSYGYQVSGISEAALICIAREKKIFNNKKVGKFRIKESYGVHSVRLFQAWPPTNPYFK